MKIRMIVKVKKYVDKGRKRTAFGVCFPGEKGEWGYSDEKLEWMDKVFYKRKAVEDITTADQLELRDIDSFLNADEENGIYSRWAAWVETSIGDNKEIEKVIEKVVSTYKELKPLLPFNWKGEKLYTFDI